MQSFWNWLFSASGAGWIIGILGVVGTIYSWLKKREYPPKVIIQELNTIILLDIHPSQQKRLEVYYASRLCNKTRILDLEQKQIVIYNSGTKDILDEVKVELSISKPNSTDKAVTLTFLDPVFDGPITSTLINDEHDPTSIKGIRIVVPFLNSYSKHQHHIMGYLISDKPFELELSSGIGKGWSAHFVALRESQAKQSRIVSIFSKVSLVLIILSFLFIIVAFVQLSRIPMMLVYFDPSTENIQAAIQEYTHRVQTLSKLDFTKRLIYPSEDLPLFFIGFAFTLMILGFTLKPLGKVIARWVSCTPRLQPISQFVHNIVEKEG